MPNHVLATSETMLAAAKHVADVNTGIQADLAGLRNRLTVLDGAWAGQARVAFDQLFVSWDSQAAKLNGALGGISENIRRNALGFDASQADHTSALGAAGAGLTLR